MKSLFFFVFFASVVLAKGQILNFEKFRPDVDTSNIWVFSGAAGFDIKQKAIRSTDIRTQVGTYYVSGQHGYYLFGDLNITRVDNANIFEQGYIHHRTVLFRKKKIAYEPFIQLQYDLGKGLKRRHLVGANVRLNFYNDTTITLSVGTGAFYENENWLDENDQTLPNVNMKSNNYVSVNWQIASWVKFLMTGYYQARFDLFLEPRLILDGNIQMNFTENFAYDLRFEVNKDQSPIVEAGRLTYLLSSGFRYSF